MLNEEIAARLNISEWAVCAHLRRMFTKLQVTSRAAMVYRCAPWTASGNPAEVWRGLQCRARRERARLALGRRGGARRREIQASPARVSARERHVFANHAAAHRAARPRGHRRPGEPGGVPRATHRSAHGRPRRAHAAPRTTAGAGDPPGYRLGDCATQRNLDDAGRAHAQRVGQWFAANGIEPGRVRNSLWCRCRDTAKLAFGRSEDWAALGNIFDRELDPAHVAEVLHFVARLKAGEVAVLVSHGVTIAALTDVHPATAEGVLVRARAGERLQVIGRLVVP